MSIKGIIFLMFAILGALLNYASAPIGKKLNISQIRLKVIGLVIVLISVSLIFIFGK